MCEVETCNRPRHCRGLCRPHYERVMRHGHPMTDVPLKHYGTPLERLMDRVVQLGPDACWIWTGQVNRPGYGRLNVGEGRKAKYAHRLSYELHVGPIPDGYEVDHLCRVRACVNPAHLEAVTPLVNKQRVAASYGRLPS